MQNITKIRTSKMQEAYDVWCKHPMVKKKKDWHGFWTFIQAENMHPGDDGWPLSPDSVIRLNYLLSPHAHTIITAWYRKHQDGTPSEHDRPNPV